ncbi:hypothetical protein [Lutibacter sp.]|uniref:hypothetical protein n=1 Tax=Lutibacter sp. TaxID=1925666 RepID=UPI0027377270|nr:hypothetical protein [Lutibacter sp.]MDP3312751.1 hypothetical protein [Lutibacter sp.]
MAENTDEKHLGNSNNTQSEKPSGEIIHTPDTETINHNQEAENKEVRHHPNLHPKSKKWKTYFLEFLMIFLAVTMGFIAENIREHFSERKIARQNLEAYRNDLLQHQELYTEYINGLNRGIPLYDSIVSVFYTQNENKELATLSRLLLEGQKNMIIEINTPTYDQLISSGSMRFIENIDIKVGITNYKNQIDHLANYNNRIINTINNQMGEFGKIVDTHDFWNTKKNSVDYTPEMQPFNLNHEQRNFIIAYYKVFTVQVISLSNQMKNLLNYNASLITMIDKELDK